MQIKINIPSPCQKALELLEAHGHEAYLVGGCVRDSVLGKEPLDWDICTEALPEEMLKIFAAYRLVLNGLKHGTVTVIINRMPIEITTYRIDGEYEDNRHPKEVHFTSNLKEDLSRRDFTINALAYNPQKGLVDYFDGLEDLAPKKVRAVGEAQKRFEEDGLRIMRAVRFACVLGFSYEEKTREAIGKCGHLLNNIATERIQIELNKILISPNVRQGLEDLYHLGLYSYFLPQMCHTYGFTQNNPFHCYDVFGHTVRAVEIVEPELVLRLTMLLHDIGKPFCLESCYGDSDCFPNHEAPSAEIAEEFLERMHYDKKTSREVVRLVAEHNYQIFLDDYSIRLALNKFGAQSLRYLLKVKEADLGAQKDTLAEVVAFFHQIEERLEEILQRGDCYSLAQLAVKGNDLINLGYQGKEVGKRLEYLLALVLKEPEINKKEILLEKIKRT